MMFHDIFDVAGGADFPRAAGSLQRPSCEAQDLRLSQHLTPLYLISSDNYPFSLLLFFSSLLFFVFQSLFHSVGRLTE